MNARKAARAVCIRARNFVHSGQAGLLNKPGPGPTCCVSLVKAAESKAQAGERMGTNSLFGFTFTITFHPGSAKSLFVARASTLSAAAG